jgi:hypothetical protein
MVGGGGMMVSRVREERERECGDKNLLCVARESARSEILVHRT